ncbi:MAG TPA: hypothetical protein VFZ74_07205 [Burkholderiales bacterium]
MHRSLVSIVFAAVAFISAVLPAGADSSEAEKTYGTYLRLVRDKHYQQAWDLLMSRKQAGDRWTEREYPEWFGRDVAPEVSALVNDWVEKAAKEGNADAQVMLATKYLQSDSRGERLAEAIALLDKAADQGNKTALYYLSQMNPKALESRGITSKYVGRRVDK